MTIPASGGQIWPGSIVGMTVRKNSGANVGTRPRLNLIEGVGIALTVADDATGNEIDAAVELSAMLDDLTDVDTTGRSDGDVLTWDNAGGAWVAAAPTGGSGGGGARVVGCCFDGSGSAVALTGSTTVTATVPVGGTLTGYRITTRGGPGSCTIEVRKCSYSGFPGSLADITGGADCVLSSAHKAEDTTLSGWTTSLTAGDVLEFTLVAASTITSVTLLLTYTPT